MIQQWTLLVVPFVVLCVQCTTLAANERLLCTRGLTCMVKKETLDFFVVGDTGGVTLKHSKSKNNSMPTQVQIGVAASMSSLAVKQPIDFIINVGDNIYSNGAKDVNDPRFKVVFEDPYSDSHLQVPWYMIAGNHDHMGNVPAQFEYTKKSNKWTFPNYFYKASYEFGKQNTKVDFVFIDTILMCGVTMDEEGRPINTTSDVPDSPEKNHEKLDKVQWMWLEDQLKTSKANYLFVTGHYPIYTISGKQVIKCLKKRLDPLLRKHKATAYLAGHHHTLQYFYDDGKKSGSEMRYIISGAGSRLNNNRKLRKGVGDVKLIYPPLTAPVYKVGNGPGGFISFSLNATGGTFNFYGNGTTSLMQANLKPRNAK